MADCQRNDNDIELFIYLCLMFKVGIIELYDITSMYTIGKQQEKSRKKQERRKVAICQHHGGMSAGFRDLLESVSMLFSKSIIYRY